MKRAIVLVVLGVLGLFAATGLTLGALAIAGDGAGTVVHPHLAPARTSSSAPEREGSRTPTPSASPSADDRGGGLEPGDDHGGSTNSGSGSSDAGSGSSGSGSSGSGSDDD